MKKLKLYFQKIKNIYHAFQSFVFHVYYRFPAKNLTIIGVTGTDGKTTCTSMVYHVLKECGLRVGMISTLHAKIDDKIIDTGLHVTTPEPWHLPKILRKMKNAGVNYVVIEATSSGLDQNRLWGIKFDSSLITYIGHDHVDYHQTWLNYAKAKFRIVNKTKFLGNVLLNKDHAKSAKWLKSQTPKFQNKRNIKWFSIRDLEGRKMTVKGLDFYYKKQHFNLPIIGDYNFSNVMGVIRLCRGYIGTLKAISMALESFKAPTGRMQIVQTKPFTVIIDFAHTPSSLKEALKSLKELKKKNSRIITVFGCAGERDPERRKMGKVSAGLSDITIVSIEDPRSEKIEDINSDIIRQARAGGAELKVRFRDYKDYIRKKDKIIRSGLPSKSIVSFDYAEVKNRRNAIEFALKLAKEGDIIFTTGKAHEESMAIGSPPVEYPYYEPDLVKNLLSKYKK